MNKGRSPEAAAAALLVGVSLAVVGLFVRPLFLVPAGLALAAGAGFAWSRASAKQGAEVKEVNAASPAATAQDQRPTSARTLSRRTLLLGGSAGLLLVIPAAGFAIVPSFLGRRRSAVDLGPIDAFPEEEFTVVTFFLDSSEGAITRRAAFVRNNGAFQGEPSFTILSNRCTHVGCPTQPNGPLFNTQERQTQNQTGRVTITPTQPAGFGCPCHGSQFDTEGNRTAGPAPRPLDRYAFSIRHGRLYLGRPYSVSHVDGVGARARIHSVNWRPPGQPASGVETLLYPVQLSS